MLTISNRASRNLRIFALATFGLAVGIAIYAAISGNAPWLAASSAEAGPPKWLMTGLIVFFGAIASSIVGFAFPAIAGALILHYATNSVEAVQIMMIASIGIQAKNVAGLWHSIQWSRCVPFLVGGVAALPAGFILLLNLQPRSYTPALGVALVAYGLYSMLRRRPAVIKRGPRRLVDALTGALGGITGPLAGFPSAFVTIWCAMRGWDKVEQRAVYQPYILIMQLTSVGALFALRPGGMFNPALLAYALPGLAGATLGLRVFHTLTDTQFQRIVCLVMIVAGSALMLK